MTRPARVAPLLLALVPFLPGCPECAYESRCDGAVVKTCSLGVDQMVGDPARGRIPCEGENPVCVNLDRRTAQCVRADAPRCDAAEFTDFCDDGAAVRCVEGYEVADDCAAHGNVCELGDGAASATSEARCVLAPATACDPANYTETCDGTGLITCEGGVVARRDCAVERPGQTCVVHRSEWGRSVYCGQE